MSGLQANGLKIPEDISVVGFDNISFSEFTTPPLTTFDQPKRTIGIKAAHLILGLLNKEDQGRYDPKVQLFQGRLLIRNSTAKPTD